LTAFLINYVFEFDVSNELFIFLAHLFPHLYYIIDIMICTVKMITLPLNKKRTNL